MVEYIAFSISFYFPHSFTRTLANSLYPHSHAFPFHAHCLFLSHAQKLHEYLCSTFATSYPHYLSRLRFLLPLCRNCLKLLNSLHFPLFPFRSFLQPVFSSPWVFLDFQWVPSVHACFLSTAFSANRCVSLDLRPRTV